MPTHREGTMENQPLAKLSHFSLFDSDTNTSLSRQQSHHFVTETLCDTLTANVVSWCFSLSVYQLISSLENEQNVPAIAAYCCYEQMQFKMGQFIVKALICAAYCQKASVCKHAVIQSQICLWRSALNQMVSHFFVAMWWGERHRTKRIMIVFV